MKTQRNTGTDRERGVALLTVLMLIASLSLIAVGLTQSVTGATRRAKLLDAQSQALWSAHGIEALIGLAVRAALDPVEGRAFAGMPGLDQVQTVPLDNGLVRFIATDAGNCYNINALASAPVQSEGLAGPGGLAFLLEERGVEPGRARPIAEAIADWVDADASPRLQGAEDPVYLSRTPRHRTPSRPISEVSELRPVQGLENLEDYRLLLIDACILPGEAARDLALNLNTLKPGQGVLLALALDGQITPERAEQLITARPAGGWRDVAAFVQEAGVVPNDGERLGLVTRNVRVDVEVVQMSRAIAMTYWVSYAPGVGVSLDRRARRE
jgi:general secretion pathway protein K